MSAQHAATAAELDEIDGAWFVGAQTQSLARMTRATLRRNSSLPSLSNAEDNCGLIPRSRSHDDEFDSDDDAYLMEVDGKAVLTAQSARTLKSNPYVGTFHYGHEASKKLSGEKSHAQGGRSSKKSSPQSNPTTADTSIAASPMLIAQESPVNGARETDQAERLFPFANDVDAAGSVSPMGSPMPNARPNRTLSRANSDSNKTITALDREKMKQALQLDESVPADPEMCGLQALLPRQSGIQVQYTIGEGSFGKCVKVVNRKNRQQWSKTTSKRGIERYLNDMPLEGDSLVVKYIKKDDPACRDNAMLFEGIDDQVLQSAVQREIRIHAKCSHPNIVRLFGVRLAQPSDLPLTLSLPPCHAPPRLAPSPLQLNGSLSLALSTSS